jgi:carbamoyltransferase
MKIILGLNCYKHDSSACLFINGELVGAAEEERFSRRKHDSGFPAKTISYLLDEAGITPADVEHVAYYMKPSLVRREAFRMIPRYFGKPGATGFFLGQLAGARKMAAVPGVSREHLGPSFKPRFHFIEHHVAHAWSAWFGAGCRDAAILTLDGAGEIHSGMLGEIASRRLRRFSVTRLPNSTGLFYSALTSYLGFKPDSDEYKVMGLASYGKPLYADAFREILKACPDSVKLNTRLLDICRGVHHSAFSDQVLSVIGPARKPGEPLDSRHENIAASGQLVLEEAGLAMAKHLRKLSGVDVLAMAGGTALNCVMNGRIEREAGFPEVLPFPASHDAGTGVGAAVAVHLAHFPDTPLIPPAHMFLGPVYTTEEIEAALVGSRVRYEKRDDLHSLTASLVEKGYVVGLYQGRMEFGPRALGNRSILADPRRPEMKDVVNEVIKLREGFRPFAPVCTVEDAPTYFQGCGKSPYMIKTYPVVPGMENVIPAVTHVDLTARVQTVAREENPFYYDVIREFGKLTGVPVVMNTSFNVRGEPIVNTPVDAIRCFYGTGIDALVMPPFLVMKERARERGGI